MKTFGILLIAFGLLNIFFPDMLAYLLGGFFVTMGLSLVIGGFSLPGAKRTDENYVKFGNYKIYR